MSDFFKIEDLSTGYSSDAMAIRNINLAIPKGKLAVVLGSNGAGKTTLLKAIMGILPAYTGQVFLGSSNLTKAPTEQRAAAGIGYVPQGRFIFPQLTVEQNLVLGCEVKKMKLSQAREIGYSFFPALAEIAGRKGGMLSGGQQQQLAIARMLVASPSLLILDEPAEGIQPNIVQEIGRILTQVSQQMGITVLLVEQFVSFALNIADVYYFMQSGSLSPQTIINQSNRQQIIEGITI